ncbi:syntaxin-132-like [Bidens hawaiensis]|uniref:syntaxin-132-like n=1 Tax=Bidens hawaiensis TaxID=980011 RepID=UPI0040491C92
MNVFSLNIRGLGSSSKADWIRGLRVHHEISFIVLQESQFVSLDSVDVGRFWGYGEYSFDWVPSSGRSGGLLSIWDSQPFDYPDYLALAIRKRMEKDVDEVGKIARGIKAKIETVNKENFANRQKPGCGPGTGVDRSRTNMTNALTKRFRDIMTEFQTLRRKIDDEYREVVERRVITVTGTRPDEETINNLIETGNSEQIFQNAMKEMGRGQVLNTLEEIQERHDAVREIEKKLLELHQIYLDMAVLIEAQGDLLDNIESQVANAVDHVHMGADALTTAKSLQRRSRKCMLIGITLLLVIAIVIILSILKPWKKN